MGGEQQRAIAWAMAAMQEYCEEEPEAGGDVAIGAMLIVAARFAILMEMSSGGFDRVSRMAYETAIAELLERH